MDPSQNSYSYASYSGGGTQTGASLGTQGLMQKQNAAPDPSNIYSQKLQQMSTGQFSPDDPSYQFRLQQGQQALERSQAAKGMAGGGGAAIELQQYGQQSASTEYGAQFTRMLDAMSGVESQYQSQYSRLATLAGVQINQQNADQNHRYSGQGGGGTPGASQDPWASYYATEDAKSASESAKKQATTPDYWSNSSTDYGGSTGGLDSNGDYQSGGGMTDMSQV